VGWFVGEKWPEKLFSGVGLEEFPVHFYVPAVGVDCWDNGENNPKLEPIVLIKIRQITQNNTNKRNKILPKVKNIWMPHSEPNLFISLLIRYLSYPQILHHSQKQRNCCYKYYPYKSSISRAVMTCFNVRSLAPVITNRVLQISEW